MPTCAFDSTDIDEWDLLLQRAIALSEKAEQQWRSKTDQLIFGLCFGEPPLNPDVVYARLKKTVIPNLEGHVRKRLSRQLGTESLAHRPATTPWNKFWRGRRPKALKQRP